MANNILYFIIIIIIIILVVAHVVALLGVSAGDGCCLALDLPLQLEEDASMGGDLGGVLVVHHAERACGSSSDVWE